MAQAAFKAKAALAPPGAEFWGVLPPEVLEGKGFAAAEAQVQIGAAKIPLLLRAGVTEAKLLKVAEHSPKPECSEALVEETSAMAIVLRAKGRSPHAVGNAVATVRDDNRAAAHALLSHLSGRSLVEKAEAASRQAAAEGRAAGVVGGGLAPLQGSPPGGWANRDNGGGTALKTFAKRLSHGPWTSLTRYRMGSVARIVAMASD